MDETLLIVAFVGAVLFLFALYHYISWSSGWRSSPHHGVLMNVTTQPGYIQGVEKEQRVFCPRKAQEILGQMVLQQQMRGVLFRDGSVWVVSGGKELTVTRLPAGEDSKRLVLYYMRQRPPQIVDRPDGQSAPPSTPDARVPSAPDIPNMVATRNAAINTTALVATSPVTRYPTLTLALEAFPATDAAGERTFLLNNGPNDPAFYVVRTQRDASNAVITATGLPGTVYARKE